MQEREAADLAMSWTERMSPDEPLVEYEYSQVVSEAFLNTGPARIYGVRGEGYDALLWVRHTDKDPSTLDILRIVPAPWLTGTSEPACAAFMAAVALSLEELPARRVRLYTGTQEAKQIARDFRSAMILDPVGDVVVSFDGVWLQIRQPG